MKVSATISIARRRQEVFDAFVSPDDEAPPTVPGARIERSVDGPLTPGETYTLTFERPGRADVTRQCTVTSISPGRGLSLESETGSGAVILEDFTFSEDGESTLVKYDSSYRPRGAFAWLMYLPTLLYRPSIRRHVLRTLQTVKSQLEGSDE